MTIDSAGVAPSSHKAVKNTAMIRTRAKIITFTLFPLVSCLNKALLFAVKFS